MPCLAGWGSSQVETTRDSSYDSLERTGRLNMAEVGLSNVEGVSSPPPIAQKASKNITMIHRRGVRTEPFEPCLVSCPIFTFA